MTSVGADLRYGVRKLVRNPGFSLLAIVILSLGSGASTAVFCMANAVLLRPLAGVADPARLVTFYRTQKGDSFDNFGYPDYLDFRDRTHSFSGVAAHSGTMVNFRYGGSERVRADLVSGNYFALLGVTPAMGRLIDAAGSNDVAVLSFDFWQRRFGGSDAALGARIVLNGYPFTVAGVAPREFHGTVAGSTFDLWVPMASQPQTIPRLSAGVLANRASGWIEIFGRLKPGTEVRQADAEMKTIAGQLALEYPVTNGSRSVSVISGLGWYPDDRAEAGSLLRILGGAVALLSFIACINLAGLFLVRASGRRREIALRLAVGATRGRMVRMLLGEGMMIAMAAGAVGLVISRWTANWLAAIRPSSVARDLDITVDWRVLVFALAASVAAGLFCALLPALQSVPVDLTAAMKSRTAGAGFRRTRGRHALMVAQVAVSFVLLTAAGNLARNLVRLGREDPGYATSRLAMGTIDLTLERYSEERGLSIYRQLLERLSALPGVQSATLAGTVPPAEWPGRVSIFHPGEEPPPEVLQGREMELGFRVDVNNVAPRYFETMGIRLLRGRNFSLQDDAQTPAVAIVNQSLAARMWPGENAIGKRFAWPQWDGKRRPLVEVIGLAADTRSRALNSPAVPLMYTPTLQNYSGRTRLVVKAWGDPADLLGALAGAVASIDPNLALFGAETMEQHVAQSLWAQRLATGWIGICSVLALGLSAVGLYGVIAHSVAQRTREVGIRLALGAVPREVGLLILKDGLVLAGAGLALGIPATVAAGYRDGLISSTAVAVLLLVLLAASWAPARRAASVHPIEALRME